MNRTLLTALLGASLCATVMAQHSDFAIKSDFEERYRQISGRLDSASTTEEIDSLKGEIGKLESEYAPHQQFLDRALYPLTFGESITKLRSLQVLTYDRVYLIRTQGVKLSEIEARITSLTTRLDSLTSQRDQLFGELQESRKSLSALREAVRRLTANLTAKDRLIFAIVDSIFLPYGKDLSQVADVQKEAIGQRLERSNVLTRVYEIAADNVKFLDATQLQGRDYGNLIEQYEAFNARWAGLKQKMTEVAATGAAVPTESTGKGTAKTPLVRGGAKELRVASETAAAQAGHVDSALAEWHTKLNAGFWGGLLKEFTQAGVIVAPFNDGPSFSASIRQEVASLAASKQDPQPFVDALWKQKIDRDWREGLSRDAMLGHAEYAALDKLVSELTRDTIDTTFIAYIAGILIIIGLIWFFVFRKKKRPGEPASAA
jgi:prefoldin subunit 5